MASSSTWRIGLPTGPLWLPDGLHWNLPELMRQILEGLGAAAESRAPGGHRDRRLGL